MYAMKDADKCRANRIVFESDSDDDNEAVFDESFPDKHVQSNTQVGATAQFAVTCVTVGCAHVRRKLSKCSNEFWSCSSR